MYVALPLLSIEALRLELMTPKSEWRHLNAAPRPALPLILLLVYIKILQKSSPTG